MNSANSNSKKVNLIPNWNSSSKVSGNDNSLIGMILFILIGLTVIGALFYVLYKYLYAPSVIKIPTTANMTAVLEKRKQELKSLYEGIDRKKQLVPLENNQNFLVNYHTLFEQAAGYLGPYENGIIDPVSAIQLSLSCGVRGFILNIEDVNGNAMIVIRNGSNVRVQMNDVYASELIDAIFANIFKEDIEGRSNIMRYDPCIIYLKFNGKVSSECAQSVANALSKYKNLLLSTNEKGDFTHCKNDNKLFLLTPSDVEGKIIVLCNIETNKDAEGFNSKKSTKVGLDYYINGRVWNYGENKVDSGPSVIKSIFETTQSYINSLNDDGITMINKDSRLKYFIVNNQYTPVNMKKITDHGLQGVGGYPFDFEAERNAFAKGGFAKNKDLRYIVSEPIQVSPAPKELNSGGGIISIKT